MKTGNGSVKEESRVVAIQSNGIVLDVRPPDDVEKERISKEDSQKGDEGEKDDDDVASVLEQGKIVRSITTISFPFEKLVSNILYTVFIFTDEIQLDLPVAAKLSVCMSILMLLRDHLKRSFALNEA